MAFPTSVNDQASNEATQANDNVPGNDAAKKNDNAPASSDAADKKPQTKEDPQARSGNLLYSIDLPSTTIQNIYNPNKKPK